MKKAVLNILLIMILFSCNSKYPLDLGKGYKLDYDANSYFDIQDSQNNIVIFAHVIDYSVDSTYIIAEQKPVDLILKNTYNNLEYNLKKRDKLFEKSTFRQYWIINKIEKGEYSLDTLTQLAKYSNVYGPFQKQEYLQKREELGISRELKLKE
ncbi:MAG: hypothetical protein ACK50L_05355 [Bacteroidota bacterium]